MESAQAKAGEMSDRTAFFYGTLMAPEVLYRVIYGLGKAGRPVKPAHAVALTIKPALLKDFCRHRVRFCDYPGIINQEGHSVKGTYVVGLTDADIGRLDIFEGSQYTRKWVEVETDEGLKKAETYIYTAGQDGLEVGDWSYEDFRKKKLHRWTALSEEFDDVDDFVAQQEEGKQNEDEGQDMDGSFVVVDRDVEDSGEIKKEKDEEVLLIAV